ncbi:hypothetical protein DFH07DRAFT_964212 [Mycena maculata]|uniref:Uncharacterized protein n=1 Tax=Mycena maculata TaxID=230809 RepID=A0AAD7IJJ2_9AGAR|nr:hypothetical protein DFH07DRAFT_964212 [Mycena maculata]
MSAGDRAYLRGAARPVQFSLLEVTSDRSSSTCVRARSVPRKRRFHFTRLSSGSPREVASAFSSPACGPLRVHHFSITCYIALEHPLTLAVAPFAFCICSRRFGAPQENTAGTRSRQTQTMGTSAVRPPADHRFASSDSARSMATRARTPPLLFPIQQRHHPARRLPRHRGIMMEPVVVVDRADHCGACEELAAGWRGRRAVETWCALPGYVAQCGTGRYPPLASTDRERDGLVPSSATPPPRPRAQVDFEEGTDDDGEPGCKDEPRGECVGSAPIARAKISPVLGTAPLPAAVLDRRALVVPLPPSPKRRQGSKKALTMTASHWEDALDPPPSRARISPPPSPLLARGRHRRRRCDGRELSVLGDTTAAARRQGSKKAPTIGKTASRGVEKTEPDPPSEPARRSPPPSLLLLFTPATTDDDGREEGVDDRGDGERGCEAEVEDHERRKRESRTTASQRGPEEGADDDGELREERTGSAPPPPRQIPPLPSPLLFIPLVIDTDDDDAMGVSPSVLGDTTTAAVKRKQVASNATEPGQTTTGRIPAFSAAPRTRHQAQVGREEGVDDRGDGERGCEAEVEDHERRKRESRTTASQRGTSQYPFLSIVAAPPTRLKCKQGSKKAPTGERRDEAEAEDEVVDIRRTRERPRCDGNRQRRCRACRSILATLPPWPRSAGRAEQGGDHREDGEQRGFLVRYHNTRSSTVDDENDPGLQCHN